MHDPLDALRSAGCPVDHLSTAQRRVLEALTEAETGPDGLRTAMASGPGVLRTSGASSSRTTSVWASTKVAGISTPSTMATAPATNGVSAPASSHRSVRTIPDSPA